jgi:membrane protein implicated in regulation of membrane protease activity
LNVDTVSQTEQNGREPTPLNKQTHLNTDFKQDTQTTTIKMAHLLFLLAPIFNLHGSLKQQITSLKATSPFPGLELEIISYILLTTIIVILLYKFLNRMDTSDDVITYEEFILEMRLQTLERRLREMRERE